MDCAIHDEAMSVVSHVPQVVASALAARLVDQPAAVLELAGPGLRDTTRIAGSDPQLWSQILRTNAGAVAGTLWDVIADLHAVTAALELVASTTGESEMEQERIVPAVAVLEAGRRGQHRIPGKHGAPPVDYTTVPVVIPDEPGALARLFAAAGEAGVNVEDVAIEHSPGQPVGLVELAVAPDAADPLRRALGAAGWSVH
jgi:prephenate dehydrogenase